MSNEPGQLVQDVVYAGLDALRAVMPLDLCACVHAAADVGPQLFLRSPALSAMDANQAFDLFTSLRATLDEGGNDDRHLEVAGFDALAVPTRGQVSRGLFVVGRVDPPLTDGELMAASGLCRSVGAVAHTVEATTRPAPERSALRVAVEVVDGVARAEVLVPTVGGVRPGQGQALSPTNAVAEATLDALDGGLKLVEVADGEVAGERTMIVLVRGDNGASTVGAALSEGDHLHATAVATLDAVARLD